MADTKNYYFICYNYNHIDYGALHSGENEITVSDVTYLLSNNKRERISFTLKNVEPGTYLISKHYVNSTHGSVLDEWNRLNCAKNMRFSDIQYLKQICIPHIITSQVNSINGCLHFSVELDPAEFSLIHLHQIYD